MLQRHLGALGISLILAGCASCNVPADKNVEIDSACVMKNHARVRVGMTLDQVTSVIGRPTGITKPFSDGRRFAMWDLDSRYNLPGHRGLWPAEQVFSVELDRHLRVLSKHMIKSETE